MLRAAQRSYVVPELISTDKKKLRIIMELVKGECLRDFMRSNRSRKLYHQAAFCLGEAILDLNSEEVIHNDLHSRNIMVEFHRGNCIARIIDLGLAEFAGYAPYPYIC